MLIKLTSGAACGMGGGWLVWGRGGSPSGCGTRARWGLHIAGEGGGVRKSILLGLMPPGGLFQA